MTRDLGLPKKKNPQSRVNKTTIPTKLVSTNLVGNGIEKKKNHHVTQGGIIKYKETNKSPSPFNLDHDMNEIKLW